MVTAEAPPSVPTAATTSAPRPAGARSAGRRLRRWPAAGLNRRGRERRTASARLPRSPAVARRHAGLGIGVGNGRRVGVDPTGRWRGCSGNGPLGVRLARDGPGLSAALSRTSAAGPAGRIGPGPAAASGMMPGRCSAACSPSCRPFPSCCASRRACCGRGATEPSIRVLGPPGAATTAKSARSPAACLSKSGSRSPRGQTCSTCSGGTVGGHLPRPPSPLPANAGQIGTRPQPSGGRSSASASSPTATSSP